MVIVKRGFYRARVESGKWQTATHREVQVRGIVIVAPTHPGRSGRNQPLVGANMIGVRSWVSGIGIGRIRRIGRIGWVTPGQTEHLNT